MVEMMNQSGYNQTSLVGCSGVLAPVKTTADVENPLT